MRLSLFRWRGGILRQFWSSFAIVLVVNQLVLTAGVYIFLFRPAIESFSSLTLALVDAGYRQQGMSSGPGLGFITPRWVSNNEIMIVPGEVEGLQPLPPYPGLRLIGARIQQHLGEQVRVGFKTDPEQMLWIQYQGARPFAVGVPMGDRLQGFKLLMAAIIVTLLLSSTAAWLIAAHLSRPIAHLSEMARRVGQGENVGDVTVSDDSPTEIAHLAAALNQMRQEINQMLSERERFLAGITHDLRTPLSRMRVALELGESRDSELNEGLRDDIEEMRAILDQFIELSKLDTEQSEPTQAADLNVLLGSIAAKYRRAGEVLVLDTGVIPTLSFKPLALTRLLYNLIDNALRYGEGGVAVQTRITETGQVCVSVTNLQSQSVRDSALVAALRSAVNGQQSGLGLAIVRRLAEVHDAEVRVLSGPMGERSVEILFTPVL